MNTIQRTWFTWRHARKFTRCGQGCEFPVPDLQVHGHVEIGAYCRFRNNVVLRAEGAGRILIAHRSGFSWNCVVVANELVRVGTRTAFAENTVICDTIYPLFGAEGGCREVEPRTAPIVIGDNCFVGSGSFVGPGVTMEEGAIVAHHSVLTRSVGAYEIWGGRPARFMAHRTKNVPEKVRREVEALMAQYGVQADRQEGRYEF